MNLVEHVGKSRRGKGDKEGGVVCHSTIKEHGRLNPSSATLFDTASPRLRGMPQLSYQRGVIKSGTFEAVIHQQPRPPWPAGHRTRAEILVPVPTRQREKGRHGRVYHDLEKNKRNERIPIDAKENTPLRQLKRMVADITKVGPEEPGVKEGHTAHGR